jgi:pimeloyl-ACP methyl ester carboxylesterase
MYQGVVPQHLVDAYVAQLQEPGALTAALGWYRAMTPELAGLPSVDVPTTFVWSDDDLAIGRAGADACGAHVSADYRYEVLEGVTHWIPEQAPDAAAAAILDRVRGVDPEAPRPI